MEIESDTEAALERRSDSADQDISVEINDGDGDMTLTGTVISWWQREIARTYASSACGILHVVAHLKIAHKFLPRHLPERSAGPT